MQVLMRCLHGSRLFGTNRPDSDTDIKSVHVPDGRDILMQSVKPVVSASTGVAALKNEAGDLDDESFALHRYFGLVRDGDTAAIEMLFANGPALLATSPAWEEIRLNRARLVNSKCHGMVGYVRQQCKKYSTKGDRVAAVRDAHGLLERIVAAKGRKARLVDHFDEVLAHVARHEGQAGIVAIPHPSGRDLEHWEVCQRKMPSTIHVGNALDLMGKTLSEYGSRAIGAEASGGVDLKAVAHALRVALEAREFLSTGMLSLPRPADEVALLKQVRAGEIPYAEVVERIDTVVAQVERAVGTSPLPKESDTALMDAMVLDLYAKAAPSAARSRNALYEGDLGTAIKRDPKTIFAIAAERAEAAKPADEATLAAIARHAGETRRMTPHEVRDGLFRILEARRPATGMRLLDATGVLDATLPEIAAMRGVVQNPYHAYQVLEHSFGALDAAAAAGQPVNLRLAAALHDIGKPSTATPRPDGRGNRFHGHETVGAQIAKTLLTRLGVDERLIDETTTLVANHMFPTRDGNGRPADTSSMRRLLERVGPAMIEPLIALRTADIMAKGFAHEEVLAFDQAYFHRCARKSPNPSAWASPTCR